MYGEAVTSTHFSVGQDFKHIAQQRPTVEIHGDAGYIGTEYSRINRRKREFGGISSCTTTTLKCAPYAGENGSSLGAPFEIKSRVRWN